MNRMSRAKRSLKEKIVFINILFFSGVLTILFVLFFSYWHSSEQNKMRADLETIANTKGEQLFSKIWNMDRTALQLASDPYISTELFPRKELIESFENYFSTDRILNNSLIGKLMPFALNEKIISRICLFNDYNDFISVGESLEYTKTQNYSLSPEVMRVKEQLNSRKFSVLIPPRDDPFYYESRLTGQSRIISVFRKIIDYSNAAYKTVGYVEVQQKTALFEALFQDLQKNTDYAVTDKEGRLLFGSSREQESQTLKRAIEISVEIDEYGLTLILKQNNSYLIRMSAILGTVLLLTLILMIMGILTTEIFVIKRLTRPLDELQQMVDNVNIKTLDFHFKTESEYDQIQHLNLAFSEMMRNLKNSVSGLVEARTDELRSHLFALQAQINPHFIHNTIALISSIADEYEAREIEEICTKLSSMIRYSSQYDSTGVALRDELNHGVNYLELMKIRYMDRVSFTVAGDKNAGTIQVPKFLLQPLIENCFSHGLKMVHPPWKIRLIVKTTQSNWTTSIEDNGGGFKDSILKEVEEMWNDLSHNKPEEILQSLEIGGMGLKNVFARLYLMYGDNMIFQLENTEMGARITIGGAI